LWGTLGLEWCFIPDATLLPAYRYRAPLGAIPSPSLWDECTAFVRQLQVCVAREGADPGTFRLNRVFDHSMDQRSSVNSGATPLAVDPVKRRAHVRLG